MVTTEFQFFSRGYDPKTRSGAEVTDHREKKTPLSPFYPKIAVKQIDGQPTVIHNAWIARHSRSGWGGQPAHKSVRTLNRAGTIPKFEASISGYFHLASRQLRDTSKSFCPSSRKRMLAQVFGSAASR